jgi:hypothetical protein
MAGTEPGPGRVPGTEPGPGRITPRQVAGWRRSGLVDSGAEELSQVRTIAAVRRSGVSLRRIRAAVDRLRASSPTPETARLRCAVHGAELYIRHPDGAWEGDRRPGQLVLDHVLPLRPVDGSVLADRARTPPASGDGRGDGLADGPDLRGRRRSPGERRPAAGDTPEAAARAAIRRFVEREQARAGAPTDRRR